MEFKKIWIEFVKDQESEETKKTWLDEGLEKAYNLYVDELHTCRHDMEDFYSFLVKKGIVKKEE